jgi:hypothetical protein
LLFGVHLEAGGDLIEVVKILRLRGRFASAKHPLRSGFRQRAPAPLTPANRLKLSNSGEKFAAGNAFVSGDWRSSRWWTVEVSSHRLGSKVGDGSYIAFVMKKVNGPAHAKLGRGTLVSSNDCDSPGHPPKAEKEKYKNQYGFLSNYSHVFEVGLTLLLGLCLIGVTFLKFPK